ncbi:MAG: hypothetical protein NT003_02830 [Candidatus Magasanikbacteria bacterium]|nr:hypothetical protein [Candidatus Magasanikbacteria bacterium]
MNASLQFSTITELPKVLVNFLLSEELGNFNDVFVKTYNLTEENFDEIIRIEGELFFRALTPDATAVSGALSSRVGISADKSDAAAKEILSTICGPVKWFFPAYSGDVNSKISKVIQPEISFDAAVKSVSDIVGDLPRPAATRLDEVVGAVLKTEKFDRAEVEKKLRAAFTEGGCGLREDVAKKVVRQIREYVAAYKINKTEAPVNAVPTRTIDPSTIPKSALTEDDHVEISDKKNNAAEVKELILNTQQQSLVDAVLAIEPMTDRSPEMQARWKSIVVTRIGGARDAVQTRAALSAPMAQGGLGVSAFEVNRLAALLEKTVGGFENRRAEFTVMEKIASVQKNATGSANAGPEAKTSSDQRELNQRFVSMFGRDAVEAIRKETRREIQTAEAAHPGQEAKSHMAPILSSIPAVTTAPAAVPATIPSAAARPITATSGTPKYVPKIPDKLRQLIDADQPIFPIKPKNVTPGAMPVSTIQSTAQVKKITDIRPSSHPNVGHRLMGPIDELASMTLVDFRRLSEDVSVRIQKIRSKLEVIGQEGPSEKVRAVHAIEQCEPIRLYREFLKRGLFTGTSVDELAASEKKLGKPSLEPDEIAALRDLLASIRYIT